MKISPNPVPIHWLAWQPTPYNDYLFRNLAGESSLDLTVHYRARVLASHPWKAALAQGYNARFYNPFLRIDWHLVTLALKERNAFFLVAGWDHPTSIILLILLRLMNRPYALWTDTPNLKRRRKPLYACLRAKALKWIFSGAVRVMGTGTPGVAALQQMGAPADRLVDFPFFLDLTAYNRHGLSRSHSGHQPLRFISSGRMANSIKGHDIAVRALAQVLVALDGLLFEYWIAGTGPDEGKLRQLVQQLGLERSVRFIGWVEPDELKLFYLEADILIHPSPVHDPFPNAVLEGMAAGLVVLASDVSGSALDRIEQGSNGFIHKAGDADELAKQILFLIQHPERISEMACRARATAEQWPVERGVTIIRELVRAR